MGKNVTTKKREAPTSIKKISVRCFKSISYEQSIEISPLTILAGANSSGKSSIMQPLLLMKQTLEAQYDPGTLLLDGPNVKFTAAEQFLCSKGTTVRSDSFTVKIKLSHNKLVEIEYIKKPQTDVEIKNMKSSDGKYLFFLRPNMNHSEIVKCMPEDKPFDLLMESKGYKYSINRNRCFLKLDILNDKHVLTSMINHKLVFVPDNEIRRLIHLPGLRGNPERTYPKTASGPNFPGVFQNYVASILFNWKSSNDKRLKQLGSLLERLGLTWKVDAIQLDETRFEIRIGRMPFRTKSGAQDLVNIADVGFGVSQTLPVLVSLLVAEPGQMVYLEQPEIHLHPRAQAILAEIIAEAAKRGVIVIVETHSSLLLLKTQSLVAEGKISKELVKLHWFSRDTEDGFTKVTSADLDERGAFGDWPVDFGDVEMDLENEYLDAAGNNNK
jgi:AAA15 family ATPase/GTPase